MRYGRLHVRDVRMSIVSRAGASELDGQVAVVVPALGSNAVELGRHLSHVVVVGMKIRSGNIERSLLLKVVPWRFLRNSDGEFCWAFLSVFKLCVLINREGCGKCEV